MDDCKLIKNSQQITVADFFPTKSLNSAGDVVFISITLCFY